MEQDEEVAGALVENAIQRPAVVTAELPERALNLRTEGEWQGRIIGAKAIQQHDRGHNFLSMPC